ncbi:Uncharacterized protein Nst1_143 [Candidatus Nanobsidianus stetteri]|uniref:Uncharacterized protein n=1 Tax=Nanobsidianus stetteri TaxID=1294122 RepID=R1GAC2_NANST|nr:Uncharacterized protein Nst1_143 [Candidatus Nanobsidianus stetteri]
MIVYFPNQYNYIYLDNIFLILFLKNKYNNVRIILFIILVSNTVRY